VHLAEHRLVCREGCHPRGISVPLEDVGQDVDVFAIGQGARGRPGHGAPGDVIEIRQRAVRCGPGVQEGWPGEWCDVAIIQVPAMTFGALGPVPCLAPLGLRLGVERWRRLRESARSDNIDSAPGRGIGHYNVRGRSW
jgi:hypothetical protein